MTSTAHPPTLAAGPSSSSSSSLSSKRHHSRHDSSSSKSKSKSKSRHDDDSDGSSSSRKSHKKHRSQSSTHLSATSSRSRREDSESEASEPEVTRKASHKDKKHKGSKHSKSSSSSSSTRPPYMSMQPLSSGLEVQYPVMTLSIPPIHAAKPMTAVEEILDSLIMRFVPPLNGVLVSYGQIFFIVDQDPQPPGQDAADTGVGGDAETGDSKSQVRTSSRPGPSALISADSAFATVCVGVEVDVWRPKIGMKLQGRITLSTPSHVSLLINSTFNASIPASCMSQYEFIQVDSEDSDEDIQTEAEEEEEAKVGGKSPTKGSAQSSYWRHRQSHLPLTHGSTLSFTVVALTISQPTLSITGSLEDRPFQQRGGNLAYLDASHSHSSTSSSRDDPTTSSTTSTSRTPRSVTFADSTKEKEKGPHDEAIRKATRRVRWSGDFNNNDGDGETTGDESSGTEWERDILATTSPPSSHPAPVSAAGGGGGKGHVRF